MADPRTDQLHAAIAEAQKVVGIAARLLPEDQLRSFGELGDPNRHVTPIHAALNRWRAAKVRHCKHLCGGPQPFFGMLREAGQANCRRCLPRMLTAYHSTDPDLCDTCGQQSEIFHELTFQVGPSILLGNACPACMRAYEEAERA